MGRPSPFAALSVIVIGRSSAERMVRNTLNGISKKLGQRIWVKFMTPDQFIDHKKAREPQLSKILGEKITLLKGNPKALGDAAASAHVGE